VVGGTFAGLWSLIWWPWTFWTFGIALTILAILSMFILPSIPLSPEVAKLSHTRKLAELDLPGASVGITAMLLFNFAWNQAPGFGWDKVYIYVFLIIGLLLCLVFFWVEMRVAKKPLIPFQALSTDVIFVLICEACGWAAFGKTLVLPPTCAVGHSTDKTRYIHLLLHADTPAAPRYLTTLDYGTAISRRHLRLYRRYYDRPCHLSHWSRLGYAHLDACILGGLHPCCYDAGPRDVLEASLCGHAYHTVGHGHEFPCRHSDYERRSGEEVREVRVCIHSTLTLYHNI